MLDRRGVMTIWTSPGQQSLSSICFLIRIPNPDDVPAYMLGGEGVMMIWAESLPRTDGLQYSGLEYWGRASKGMPVLGSTVAGSKEEAAGMDETGMLSSSSSDDTSSR